MTILISEVLLQTLEQIHWHANVLILCPLHEEMHKDRTSSADAVDIYINRALCASNVLYFFTTDRKMDMSMPTMSASIHCREYMYHIFDTQSTNIIPVKRVLIMRIMSIMIPPNMYE